MLESAHVLAVSLRVVLLEDGGVLGQETLLLLLDDGALTNFFLLLELLLGLLESALLLVDSQLFLPQALDFALVLQLAHASSLSVHLLQSLVLCELFHQLALELFLHTFLLLCALGLESELVLTGSLEFLSNADTFLGFSPLLGHGSLFALLDVEFVSELLLEGLLGSSLLLFSRQLLEDFFTSCFDGALHLAKLLSTFLLLLSVTSDHLIFVLLHLFLALKESALFILRENHVSLGLLFLLLDDAHLFVVFVDHALDDGVNLSLLL